MKRFIRYFLFIIPLFIFGQSINLQTITTGLNAPVDIKNAGDSRLFVVEQGGLIKIIDPTGTNAPKIFLDLSNLTNSGGERGLLSVAFHPNYTTNGKFYVYYTDLIGNSVIAQYNVSSTDPDIADPTATILLSFSQPFSNHNGGCMQFGPDGYLYISSGDGGSGGDPGDRSQNNTTLLGKLLRIDVNTTSGNLPYGIPATNPFASSNGADEIYSTGLRNAWKFSFDRNNGDIWIGDVGQNTIEEINRLPHTVTNANYGWRCYEGSSSFNSTGNCPPDSQLTFPVAEYAHSGSGAFKCSITGGYVYRGTQNPSLQGLYIFADFCSNEIASVSENNGIFTTTFLQAFPNEGFSSFGEDNNGELYLCGLSSGNLYKINQATASLEDTSAPETVIFPNPARDQITIRSGNTLPKQFELFDIQGKKVWPEKAFQNEIILDVSRLIKGIYFIRIKDSKQEEKLKMIIY